MQKETILIINPEMETGGVARSLLSLINALPEDRFKIDLMLLHRDGGFLEHVPDYVNIIDVPFGEEFVNKREISFSYIRDSFKRNRKYISLLGLSVAFIIKNLDCDRMLRHILVKQKIREYDFVLNYPGITHFTSIIAESVKCKKRCTWIHTEFTNAGRKKIRCAYRYRQNDLVFAVSNACREEFIRLMPDMAEKTYVQYNIIDTNMYRTMAEQAESFNDGFRATRILTVGRLSREKGYDLAVDAANALSEKGIEFRWYFIGEGAERSALEKKIKDKGLQNRVMLLGEKTNPYGYFRDCDIYVQPSRFEGYCLTVAEARAFYKPVVATDFAGAREQIIDGKTGVITECNFIDIAKSVEKIICSQDRMRTMKKNLAESTIDNRMDIERFMDALHK